MRVMASHTPPHVAETPYVLLKPPPLPPPPSHVAETPNVLLRPPTSRAAETSTCCGDPPPPHVAETPNVLLRPLPPVLMKHLKCCWDPHLNSHSSVALDAMHVAETPYVLLRPLTCCWNPTPRIVETPYVLLRPPPPRTAETPYVLLRHLPLCTAEAPYVLLRPPSPVLLRCLACCWDPHLPMLLRPLRCCWDHHHLPMLLRRLTCCWDLHLPPGWLIWSLKQHSHGKQEVPLESHQVNLIVYPQINNNCLSLFRSNTSYNHDHGTMLLLLFTTSMIWSRPISEWICWQLAWRTIIHNCRVTKVYEMH